MGLWIFLSITCDSSVFMTITHVIPGVSMTTTHVIHIFLCWLPIMGFVGFFCQLPMGFQVITMTIINPWDFSFSMSVTMGFQFYSIYNNYPLNSVLFFYWNYPWDLPFFLSIPYRILFFMAFTYGIPGVFYDNYPWILGFSYEDYPWN